MPLLCIGARLTLLFFFLPVPLLCIGAKLTFFFNDYGNNLQNSVLGRLTNGAPKKLLRGVQGLLVAKKKSVVVVVVTEVVRKVVVANGCCSGSACDWTTEKTAAVVV